MSRLRIVLAAIFGLVMAGCATAPKGAGVDQLQMRVTELEKKVEEKDQEIVDLKYEVKDLSSQVQTQKSGGEQDIPVASEAATSDTGKSSVVVKVSATGIQIQKALKNAGFYKGAVDGKLGPQTKKALEAFQRENSLTADGVVGRKTWQDLQKYLK